MPAQLMLGKPIVDSILESIQQEQTHPTLGIIQVGDQPESNSYITQAQRTVNKIRDHMHLRLQKLSEEVTAKELRELMLDWNADPAMDGYMLLQPLTRHLEDIFQEIRRWINPKKDVDLLGFEQRGVFLSGKLEGQMLPPTPYAVIKCIRHFRDSIEDNIKGKTVTVVGDGKVGSMLKVMLGNDGATQIMCNEHTPPTKFKELVGLGDIVVGAADNAADIITADMIKEGAVVINVGMKKVGDTFKGNVLVDDAMMERASKVTPILGGLGPVTVVALMRNTCKAARMK